MHVQPYGMAYDVDMTIVRRKYDNTLSFSILLLDTAFLIKTKEAEIFV